MIGTAQAASAKERTQSAIMLQPGQFIVFKIPFDRRLAAQRFGARGKSSGRITLAATLYSMEVEGDNDFNDPLSEPVVSENGLPWSLPVQ